MRDGAYHQAMAVAPRAMRPQGRLVQAGLVVAGLAAFIAMCADLNLAPDALFAGLDKLGRFAEGALPPSDGGDPLRIVKALAETFAMAFAGTVLAALAALPLGALGAKTVVGQPVLHFAFRRALDWFRGVPALVWALILVSAFGLGPFGGVIALALADIPSLAKLFSEAIENCDEKPIEGVRAAGVPPLMALRYGLAPQVTPVMASQCLFFLESNFRNAAVLGIVGAGGIGFELEERIRIFAFDEVLFIVGLYMLCVAALDTVSQRLRASLA
ncbi:phosphonate ABC transporter, permease protein PhnE [Phenylobacterium sp. LH3H17]|uniref:phosphonate ABC transporter, permease protein PhnE n=1 Tax=Phenylobacterium sp. LH3H17 TaxID=2903901 RepID=UPI0020CA13C4|nr:phosphonate ABC transporter, permease protein PhnE [Phenylobacterium sp. LH3H17]UTP38495.1 phosphonate ABC transporter, permease protein PhnE [Phenylobacterium sp. LH3H17]